MLIHRDALAVSEVGTVEDSRYFLNGALIDKEGRTVATDGHMLVRFASEPLNTAAFPAPDGVDVEAAADVIVSRDDLRAALATIKKSQSPLDSQYLAIVPNGKEVTIATSKRDRTVQITARKVDGTFPTYEPILKVKAPVVATVMLNPMYLEALGRIAKQVGAKSVTLTLHSESTAVMNQVMFTAQGENGTLDGAVMPMRP